MMLFETIKYRYVPLDADTCQLLSIDAARRPLMPLEATKCKMMLYSTGRYRDVPLDTARCCCF